MALSRQERYLVHQVHPAKLGTDSGVALVSTVLFWRHRLVPGLLIFLGPPVVASALVMTRDLEPLAGSRAGRYVLNHMPPSMQAVRAVSAVLLAVGGWRRSPRLLATALALVALGWSHGSWTGGLTPGATTDRGRQS